MGFGSIIGQILFIVVVLIVAANFIIQNNANVNTYTLAKKDSSDISLQKETSRIEIMNVSTFGSSPKILNITLKNSGKLKLDKGLIDIYVDNKRIPRVNYTSVNKIDLINPGIFDPDETIELDYSGISVGNHYITAVDEYGTKSNRIIIVT